MIFLTIMGTVLAALAHLGLAWRLADFVDDRCGGGGGFVGATTLALTLTAPFAIVAQVLAK